MAEPARNISAHHLAQVNVARMRYAPDDPRMAGFFEGIERINALADASPGFVWRLDDDAAEAEARRLFADERLLFNLSLWSGPEALREFVYRTEHAAFVRRRSEWFEPLGGPAMALWWQRRDRLPGIMEARHRLELLRMHGPSADAFTFGRLHDVRAATPTGG